MMLIGVAALVLVQLVNGLHEDVVDGILAKASPDITGKVTSPPAYTYQNTISIGSISTVVKVSYSGGQFVVKSLKRSGDVAYNLPDQGTANFVYPLDLEVHFDYDYWLYVSSDKLSTGSASGDWLISLALDMDVKADKCSIVLKSVKGNKSTDSFVLEAKPSDESFFPVTIRLEPGNGMETRFQSSLQKLLQDHLGSQKLCDCINCYN